MREISHRNMSNFFTSFTRLLILLAVLCFPQFVTSLELDLNDHEALRDAAALVAEGLMDYYTGNQYGKTVGMFSEPYYWWEAGGAWGTLLDYWYFMDDDTYNDDIMAAMMHQTGENNDYVPLNQTTTEGNDDQAFWGIAAMTAAERNFTNPPEDQPQWLYLAQAVFNTMASRWDYDTCGGGLRWQIFVWNSGYDYKNTVSNGALFHLAARLARYTSNDSYVEWAHKVYDWMYDVHLISNGTRRSVYDGTSITDNCSVINLLQWTYNQGLMMAGSAYLYDFTRDDVWHQRALDFLDGSSVFFKDDVVYEAACQDVHTCNNDQRSFKAYFGRFLGLTAQLLPETRTTIMQYIRTSAAAAARSCSGGTDGHTCGMNWSADGWDGYYGLGEQMAALEFLINTLALEKPAPYTALTGGSSIGDGAAGTEQKATNLSPLHITGGSKAGAAFITILITLSGIGCFLWLAF